MNSDFIDAILTEIGSQSPRALYDRYIASRQCRKSLPASRETLSQLQANINVSGPELCQIFKEATIKDLEENQTQSILTISADRRKRLISSNPRVPKNQSKRYPSGNDDTGRKSKDKHIWVQSEDCEHLGKSFESC